MTCSTLFRSGLAAALLLTAEAALAQSPVCQQYRAELAALDRGGGRPASAAADRQRAEIARMTNYYRSIGCERGPFGFFSGPPPAECGSIGQRIRQMEASYGSLAAQASQGGDARRQQLLAAIQQSCTAPQQQAGPQGFFETLFGPPRGARPVPPQGVPEGMPDPMEAPDGVLPGDEHQPLGGRRLACVRTCDGFFFPLANAPGGRENADEMCQALCPGAETQAFAMPGSDDAISRAISLRGRPYASLPMAFKFQKSFDGACACKKDGETWATLLRRAEGMLDQKRGDLIVTAQKAEELSRPKPVPAQAPPKKPDPKKPADAAAAEDQAAAAESGAAAPTASQESAGIGPKSIETGRVIPKGEGVQREVADPSGTRKAVRVIAPNIIPVPEARRP
jgi:hypothetical protein